MPGPVLPPIDWSAPWFEPWQLLGPRWLARVQAGASVAAVLDEEGQAPRRFVAADAAPPGEAYEAFIARSGCVPARDNLHDFFNGGVWHLRPALKARLNALQAAAIARDGVGPVRGPLRDALTRFDENGALIEAPEPLRAALIDALRAQDWQRLFVAQRPLWSQARVVVFGHAALEQLVLAPRKSLTAFVFDGDPLAADEAAWRQRPLLPLPIAGVPGWWPGQSDAGFYDDVRVFRPPRTGSPPKSLHDAGSGPQTS